MTQAARAPCSRVSIIAALFLIGLLPAKGRSDPAAWHDPVLITDFTFGIFCYPPAKAIPNGDKSIEPIPKAQADIPVLLRETRSIPAIDGLLFGIMARERTATEANETIILDHPPLGAESATQEIWTTRIESDRSTFQGYFLRFSEGNPEGRWVFTALRDNRMLIQVQFDVTPAEPQPGLSGPCVQNY